MFKLFSAFVVTALGAALAMPVDAQQKGPVSPHDKVGAKIGGKQVTIYYGRPYTKDPKTGKDRVIWGGLVPYGKAWRAGADEATTLISSADLMIGDTMVPAGAYTLYMMPVETGTTKLAISKKIGFWGIPVDTTKDLAQVDMKKDKLDTKVDQFTIAITAKKGEPNEIQMMWEMSKFSVPVALKK